MKGDSISAWLRADLAGQWQDLNPVQIRATRAGRSVQKRKAGKIVYLEELSKSKKVVRTIELDRAAVIALIERIGEPPKPSKMKVMKAAEPTLALVD